MNRGIFTKHKWPTGWWTLIAVEPVLFVAVFAWFEANRPGLTSGAAAQAWRSQEMLALSTVFAGWGLIVGIATLLIIHQAKIIAK